ncbi:MAG TPA: NAD-dependent epimerase/dehydratase family protein [bacterium]|nr:NAD-dependent epimerase/dehydratase family protein [bacterium]HPN42797.1 NAD-dependent epimerase/dehydratase family protein [bacterium]
MLSLVTGSNGFIGSTLVEALLKKQIQVRCLVRKTSDLRWLQGLDVDYVYGELRDPASLAAAVAGTDLVFHLAGVTRAKDEAGFMDANVQGTENLLAACKQHGPSHLKFIFASSQAAGGPGAPNRPLTEFDTPQPISQYGKSKLLAEQAVLNYADSLAVTVIRPPSVYGPKDKDILAMFKMIDKGVALLPGSGKSQASMVYIDDLVAGLLLAAEQPAANGKVFYIAGDEQYDWRTITTLMAAALGKKPLRLSVPLPLLDVIAFFSELGAKISHKPALLNRDKVLEMKQASWLCSNARAKQELGFAPHTSLAQGCSLTAAWYRQMGWL